MKPQLKVYTLIAAIAIAGSFSSCKKCYTCIAVDDENNAVYEYPSICGSKKDFRAYEERCKSEYGTFGFACSCGEME